MDQTCGQITTSVSPRVHITAVMLVDMACVSTLQAPTIAPVTLQATPGIELHVKVWWLNSLNRNQSLSNTRVSNMLSKALTMCHVSSTLTHDGEERFQVEMSCFVDVDECAEQADGCSDTCVNIDGSFVCVCPEGLMLGYDSLTCQGDISSGVGPTLH